MDCWKTQENRFKAELGQLLHSREESDVTLVCEGKEYPANRLILKSGCDYFKTFFNSDFADSQKQKIELPAISSYAMKFVLDFIYLQKPDLPTEFPKLLDLIKTAGFLQLQDLEKACINAYLKDLKRFSFSKLWNCCSGQVEFVGIENTIVNELLDNLAVTVSANDFVNLNYGQLKVLMKSAFDSKYPADLILTALLKWILYDKLNRLVCIPEMFYYVKANCFSCAQLKDLLEKDDAIEIKPLLQTVLDERMAEVGEINTKILFAPYENSERFLQIFDVHAEEWSCLVKVPFEVPKGSAYFNGAIFLNCENRVRRVSIWLFEETEILFDSNTCHSTTMLLTAGSCLYCICYHRNLDIYIIYRYDEVKNVFYFVDTCIEWVDFSTVVATSDDGCVYFYSSTDGLLIAYNLSKHSWKCIGDIKVDAESTAITLACWQSCFYISMGSDKIVKFNRHTKRQEVLILPVDVPVGVPVAMWCLRGSSSEIYYLLLMFSDGGMCKYNPHSGRVLWVLDKSKLNAGSPGMYNFMCNNHASAIPFSLKGQ